MSTARKSTGGARSVNRNNSRNQTARRSQRMNFTQMTSDSSSDSEVPTQRLRSRNSALSTPSPSGTSSRVINSSKIISSDSESDDEYRRPPPRRRIQREESTSDTTSDSDIPEYERSIRKSVKLMNKTQPTKVLQEKQRNQRKKSPDDDIDGNERQNQSVSTSQVASTSQVVPTPRNISCLVNKCVYYLLVADQNKYAIRRQDITKHVLHNQDHKLFKQVIEGANTVLKEVYGIEIIAHENRRGEFLLINCLDRDHSVEEYMELTDENLQRRGLIFYLLTQIFMNENSINEEDLWVALKVLGIDVNSKSPHPIFGDVKRYIKVELVKQMYLDYRCISKDPPLYEFSWGIRAKQEVDKEDLLEFTCKILGDTKPEDWILQYKDAKAGKVVEQPA